MTAILEIEGKRVIVLAPSSMDANLLLNALHSSITSSSRVSVSTESVQTLLSKEIVDDASDWPNRLVKEITALKMHEMCEEILPSILEPMDVSARPYGKAYRRSGYGRKAR